MSRELAGLIRMGKNAFSEADCLRAERHLLEALEGGAKYPDIHYTLGLIDHQRGNYRRAVERFGQAVSLNPDYTEALLSLSITLNDMGRYDEARDAYDRAAEILSRNGGVARREPVPRADREPAQGARGTLPRAGPARRRDPRIPTRPLRRAGIPRPSGPTGDGAP